MTDKSNCFVEHSASRAAKGHLVGRKGLGSLLQIIMTEFCTVLFVVKYVFLGSYCIMLSWILLPLQDNCDTVVLVYKLSK